LAGGARQLTRPVCRPGCGTHSTSDLHSLYCRLQRARRMGGGCPSRPDFPASPTIVSCARFSLPMMGVLALLALFVRIAPSVPSMILALLSRHRVRHTHTPAGGAPQFESRCEVGPGGLQPVLARPGCQRVGRARCARGDSPCRGYSHRRYHHTLLVLLLGGVLLGTTVVEDRGAPDPCRQWSPPRAEQHPRVGTLVLTPQTGAGPLSHSSGGVGICSRRPVDPLHCDIPRHTGCGSLSESPPSRKGNLASRSRFDAEQS
jgi:hypothetical protein